MEPLLADSQLLDGIVMAVENVRERMRRAARALEQDKIPYAVVGGNAVAAWVYTVEPAAVRFTQDVDILLNCKDLDRAALSLEGAGFIRRRVAGIEMFLDGPNAKPRDAVRVVMAGEKVRPDSLEPSPELRDTMVVGDQKVQIVPLEALVRMKLTSYRLKDRVHLQDMLEVGLIGADWVPQLPPTLGERLQALIDSPEQ